MTVPTDSAAGGVAVPASARRARRRRITRSAASIHPRASAASRSCRPSSASSLPLALAARWSPCASVLNRTRAASPTETVRRPRRPAHSKIARAVRPALASAANAMPVRTASGSAFSFSAGAPSSAQARSASGSRSPRGMPASVSNRCRQAVSASRKPLGTGGYPSPGSASRSARAAHGCRPTRRGSTLRTLNRSFTSCHSSIENSLRCANRTRRSSPSSFCERSVSTTSGGPAAGRSTRRSRKASTEPHRTTGNASEPISSTDGAGVAASSAGRPIPIARAAG